MGSARRCPSTYVVRVRPVSPGVRERTRGASDDHAPQPSRPRCGAPSRSRRPPASRSAPTRASAACCSTTTARTVAEGYHRGAGTPHAEADALARAGDRAARHHRRRHPRAVQPHRPHRPVRAGAGRGRRTPGGVRPGRPQPGRGRGRRHAARRGRRGRVGTAGGRVAGAEPGLDLRGRARPPVRHLEVRHHPRRPQRRRRRHQPLGAPARPPASTPTGCGRCAT